MSLSIYEDMENAGAMQTRNGAKRAENGAQKRTALGQLANNIRQQPSRAAKNAPFKVYEDKENKSRYSGFDDAIKQKSKRFQPLQPVQQQQARSKSVSEVEVQRAFDSPMVLDVSTMDLEEGSGSDSMVSDDDSEPYYMREYQDDIHDYLREAEVRFMPKAHYMRKQPDISPQMRLILVDWLVEVGEEYKLHDETLHLAINYIDRFLSQMSVLRGKLQLVGTACMFLASKFEEIYPPDAGEFVYITDDTYTKKQLLKMEHLVIKVLGFDVSVPTSNVFLDFYCHKLNVSDTLKSLAQYISELSLLDCDHFLIHTPSKIASSALFLASHIVDAEHLPPSLSDIEKVTRYRQSDVASCVQKLLETLKAASEQPQQAIREKFKSDERHAVSSLPIPDLC